MKYIIFAALILGSVTALATPVACQKSALDIAKYIDKSGWGEVTSEPLVVKSAVQIDDLNREEHYIIYSPISGYNYKLVMIQNQKSSACITISVNTN